MAGRAAVACALSVENSVAKVPQRCLSDVGIQPPIASQDPEAVTTVMHVSSNNVSMCIHFRVATGAGDLGHAGGDVVMGLIVSEFCSSPNAFY